MKILGVERYGIEDVEYDTAQRVFDGQWYRRRPIRKPRLERRPVCALPLLQRCQVELELQLARQRLERQQPRGGACHSLYFSPCCLRGEF